jgi:hypothetical protein
VKAWLILLLFATSAHAAPWVIYFQEDCLSCRKQLKELDCFAELGIPIKLVGIGESRIRLHHEVRRQTKAHYELEIQSWQDVNRLGIFATPTHERVGRQGRKERILGIIPCKDA